MRRLKTLLLAALTVTLAGCSHQPGTSNAASEAPAATVTGIFTGSVTKGPTAPVLRAGASPVAAGVANARVDIAAEDGTPLTSVLTDAAGRFSLSLAPGSYKVTMKSLQGAMFARDLPATVSIVAGQETRLDIHLDTGIR